MEGDPGIPEVMVLTNGATAARCRTYHKRSVLRADGIMIARGEVCFVKKAIKDFSTSFEMKFGKFGTYKQNWNFWDQNLGL